MSRTARYRDLQRRLGSRRLNNVLFISRRYRTVYVSNPKAACSSLKLYLSRAELDDREFEPEDLHARRHTPLLRPAQLSPAERESILDGAFFVFSFVRHPLRRAVSAFADKIEGNAPQKAEILRALNRDPSALETPVRFDEFVDVITSQEPAQLNPHWRPQAFNLVPDLLPYDFIGHVESIDHDIAALRSRLGLPDFPLSRRNPKAKRVDGAALLTRRARYRLSRLYAGDFAAFGYEPQDRAERLGVHLGLGGGRPLRLREFRKALRRATAR